MIFLWTRGGKKMKNIQKALCLMLVLCLTLVAGAALAQDYTATEKGFGGDR